MAEPSTSQLGLWIGILSAVIAFIAAVRSGVSAKAAERSADAAVRSATAAERSVELKEAEILKRRRDEVVSRLAASWARGWALDNTNAAIQLIPEWLLPEFEALVREAWARNPKGPQRTAEQIIESHLKRDPELRRKVERTLS